MSASKQTKMSARKELLLARASIERIELAAHVGRVKSAMAPSSLIRSFWPGLTAQGGASAAFRVWNILRRYPIVSSAASMLVTRIPFRGVFRLLKLSGGAFAAYQGFKIWQVFKSDPEERARRTERRELQRAARAARRNPPAPPVL
jgi:threonine/homoserine/homoserine lactone efflux protein